MNSLAILNRSSLALLVAFSFACGGSQDQSTTTPVTTDTTDPVADSGSDTGTADTVAAEEPFKGPPWMKPGADIKEWEWEFERQSRELAFNKERVVAEMKIPAGAAIADVGAGTGLTLGVFSEAVGAEGKVYGIEIALPFVEWMKKKVQKNGWTNVEVVHSKPETTTLPDNSVDIVFLAAVYHHLGPNAKPMMEDFKRILKPGGVFYLVDFDRREGVSTDWVLKHLSQSRADMVNEIVSFGFFKEEGSPDARFMGENFMARFVLTK